MFGMTENQQQPRVTIPANGRIVLEGHYEPRCKFWLRRHVGTIWLQVVEAHELYSRWRIALQPSHHLERGTYELYYRCQPGAANRVHTMMHTNAPVRISVTAAVDHEPPVWADTPLAVETKYEPSGCNDLFASSYVSIATLVKDASAVWIRAHVWPEGGAVWTSLFPVHPHRFDSQVRDVLVPIAWSVVNDWVVRDCTGSSPNCCADGTIGATVIGLFDSMPEDCRVSITEITESNLVKSLLTPDVDLYDAEGRHNPRCDGTLESLSFGISFTAVPATF